MINLYTTSISAWKSILDDCQDAKSYIYFEQFILSDFDDGEIGKVFFDMFIQKAKEGVEVKLIIDAIGSLELFTSPFLQEKLETAGVELIFFGMVPKWKAIFPFNQIHRDHRKLVVIDDDVAHVGGVVVTELSREWHDIDSRILDFEYIKEIKGAFLRMWDEIKDIKENESQYNLDKSLILETNPEDNALKNEILKRLRNAKTKVVIVTPYFSPDKHLLKALLAASRRGVNIKLIIPEKSDSKLTNMVTGSYFKKLSKSKIEIYFHDKCMNHGKLVMIDGWITLGSMNFDSLSLFYNRELNIVINESEFDWEGILKWELDCSKKMEKDYMKKRGKIKILEDMIGKIFRPIA